MGVKVSKPRYEALQTTSPMDDLERQRMAIDGAVLKRLERFKVKFFKNEARDASRLPSVDCSYMGAGYFLPPPKTQPIDLVRAIKVHGVIASDNSVRTQPIYTTTSTESMAHSCETRPSASTM